MGMLFKRGDEKIPIFWPWPAQMIPVVFVVVFSVRVLYEHAFWDTLIRDADIA